MFDNGKMVKMTIDRSEWLPGTITGDGKKIRESKLLTQGRRCCLGVLLALHGVEDSYLDGVGTPLGVVPIEATPRNLREFLLKDFWDNSDWTIEAMNLNDYGCTDRGSIYCTQWGGKLLEIGKIEKGLVDHFKEVGIELSFTGELAYAA